MANLNLNKGTTAVLAISFFKGTAANSSMLKERNTLGAARKVMDAARTANVPVIHSVMGFREGYPEVSDRNKLFSRIKESGGFRIGSDAMEICDEVKPALHELVVSRPRINPFYNSELQSILSAGNIDTLAIMGVATQLPVAAATRHAADADYRVVVLEDCCAAPQIELHDWIIENVLSRLAEIASSRDFVESVQ